MKLCTRLICAATLAALASTPAMAAELTGTLKKIKETGVIVLGNRDASIPFSYYDNNQKPVGYSVDLANKVVDALKKELKMPNLQVKYNLVTSQTRIPLVQNGTVDLECGSTTNNVERQKQVAFSVGIFEIGTRLLTAKTSGVKDFADLKGKNVVTTAGTTSERLLKAMNAEKQLGMNIISAKDHGESFLMLESGRAVAFMMDDALLYGEMAKAKNPAGWVVTGKPQSFEIYGCMLRKDDAAFKKAVDDSIVRQIKDGSLEKLYDKWFMQPIPPNNVKVGLPLSAATKDAWANPNDKPMEAYEVK
jgi:glutamate/aspartate transport system substrate-binding protein